METSLLSQIVIICIMLLFSAFCSGMEIAFLSRNRLREEIDRKQSPMFDRIAELFTRNKSNYITTILVGNNIALVVYSIYISALLADYFSVDNPLAQTIISTIIIIFIGEYIPKSIVRRSPNFYYLVSSPVMYVLYIVLYPLSRLTTLLSYAILRLTGSKIEPREEQTEFNRDDLARLVDDDNVVVFVRQLFGKGRADLAGSYDNDTHNKISVYVKQVVMCGGIYRIFTCFLPSFYKGSAKKT